MFYICGIFQGLFASSCLENVHNTGYVTHLSTGDSFPSSFQPSDFAYVSWRGQYNELNNY